MNDSNISTETELVEKIAHLMGDSIIDEHIHDNLNIRKYYSKFGLTYTIDYLVLNLIKTMSYSTNTCTVAHYVQMGKQKPHVTMQPQYSIHNQVINNLLLCEQSLDYLTVSDIEYMYLFLLHKERIFDAIKSFNGAVKLTIRRTNDAI